MRICFAQLAMIGCAWAIAGCAADPQPDQPSKTGILSSDPRSESEILSSQYGPIPPPAERSVCECGSITEATFDSASADTDFDRVVGPRLERWERVRGPRVRIEGTAKYRLKNGGQVIGESYSISLIDDRGFHFQWPKQMDSKRVVVEGCLSRIYYPLELSHPDTSKWKPDEGRISNTLRSWPFGFVYELHKSEYRFPGDERTETN